jgi:hypothetical protein
MEHTRSVNGQQRPHRRKKKSEAPGSGQSEAGHANGVKQP